MYDKEVTEKILGYILLVTGILIILFAGLSVYNVFTKKITPVKLFDFKAVSIDASKLIPQNSIPTENVPPEIAKLLPKNSSTNTEVYKTEILPADMINDTSNIFAHLLLMGFIASIGFKLAQLGTMLVRPIMVKLKAKEVETAEK